MLSLFVFLTGALIALYSYKPFVNFINELLGFIYIKRHHDIIFNNKNLLINNYDHNIFKSLGFKKINSFTKYSAFINKNFNYKNLKKYINQLMVDNLKIFIFYFVIFVILPSIISFNYAFFYLAGFFVAIIYHYLYGMLVNKNNYRLNAINSIIKCLIYTYDKTYPPEHNKPKASQDKSDDNSANTDYAPIVFNIKGEHVLKKILKILSLTLPPLCFVLYITTYFIKNEDTVELLLNLSSIVILLYIALVGIVIVSFIVLSIIEFLKTYRPN